MNYNQKKIYTAFMESVCKKFKCMSALPSLKEGFRALCEAEGVDGETLDDFDATKSYHEGEGLYYSSANFLSTKSRDELDVDEIMSHLDTWHREPFEPWEFASRIDYLRGTHDEVIVDERNMVVTLSSSKTPNGYGEYHYHVAALKVAPVDVEKEFNKYLGFGEDRDTKKNPKPPAWWGDKPIRKQDGYAYKHPAPTHFSTGAFSALEDDDL